MGSEEATPKWHTCICPPLVYYRDPRQEEPDPGFKLIGAITAGCAQGDTFGETPCHNSLSSCQILLNLVSLITRISLF